MNVRVNLLSPETRVYAENFAAESIGLSLLVLTQLFSKSRCKKILDVPVQKQNLT